VEGSLRLHQAGESVVDSSYFDLAQHEGSTTHANCSFQVYTFCASNFGSELNIVADTSRNSSISIQKIEFKTVLIYFEMGEMRNRGG
jgi:hypothetical protein